LDNGSMTILAAGGALHCPRLGRGLDRRQNGTRLMLGFCLPLPGCLFSDREPRFARSLLEKLGRFHAA
jgi:hypothetical protein